METKMFSFGEIGRYVIVSLKGATVISYIFNNVVVIFPQTLVGSKIRGGIPICFPFFGSPKPKFAGEISQHGWLRDQQFAPHREGENSVILRGFMNGQVKTTYPWAFLYDVEISIEPKGTLALELCAVRLNDGIDDLAPVNPGFHPYFCNLGRKAVIINGDAWIAEEGPAKIVPAAEEILIDMGAAQVKMSLGGDFDEKSCFALWTDNAKKYFCVEPILTHPDDFDTPNGKFLERGQMLKLYCSISVFP
jgi:galactose mutarotase-like enzyme